MSRKCAVFSLEGSFRCGEDGVGVFGPGEGVAAVVVAVDEAADGGDEVFDAGEAGPRQRRQPLRAAFP